MKEQTTFLKDFSDRELLQLIVVSMVEVEKRATRIERFLSQKYGDEFADFDPPSEGEITKTMIDYHDSAESEMESN